MNQHELTIQSPVGALRLVSTDDALVACTMAEHEAAQAPMGTRAHPILDRASAQLREYFEGHRQRFEIPLAPSGTQFQQAVWAALSKIPYGETTTYAAIASSIGRPAAIRAVGNANSRNPIAIIVPCHRVIGSDGTLTGYAGGLPRKQQLLNHEAAVMA